MKETYKKTIREFTYACLLLTPIIITIILNYDAHTSWLISQDIRVYAGTLSCDDLIHHREDITYTNFDPKFIHAANKAFIEYRDEILQNVCYPKMTCLELMNPFDNGVFNPKTGYSDFDVFSVAHYTYVKNGCVGLNY